MSADGLFVIGATHHRAPLAVREKLSLATETAAALHSDFAALKGLSEFAVLSTCNRVEIYGVGTRSDVAAQICAAFCARQQFDAAEFEKIRLELRGRDAVRHLVEVSVGRDRHCTGGGEPPEPAGGVRSDGPLYSHLHRAAIIRLAPTEPPIAKFPAYANFLALPRETTG